MSYEEFVQGIHHSNFCRLCNKLIDANNKYCYPCWQNLKVSIIIENKLFLSDYETSTKYDLLKSHGITQILTIGKELPKHEHADFTTMHISIDDAPSENISEYFDAAHDFIDQAPTLVHCYAGISRSTTVVISYLINRHYMSFKEALLHCKERRPVIHPNHGFIKQLKDYAMSIENDRSGEIFILDFEEFEML